jgi:hypothetical protein
MTFFYDLNKKLDSIREKPETTHKQLNERDEGKPGKNFAKIAKDAGERYGSKAAGERVAGAVRNKLKAQGKLEEEGMGDMMATAGAKLKGLKANITKNPADRQSAVDAHRGIMKKELSKVKPGDRPELGGPSERYRNAQHSMATHKIGLDNNMEEGMGDVARKVGGMAKKVGGAVLNKLGHGDDEAMRKDLQRKMGVPKQQQHGKPGMAKSNEDYGPMEGDGGKPMTPKQKSFAKLAPPADKITFADKIAGAKKEVDERLGDVAAEAIKGALSPKQKKIDMNKNGKLDANDFAMLRKGGKKQVADEGWDDMVKDVHARAAKPKVGSVERGHKHDIEHTATGRKVTRRVDDQGHSVGADDASDTPPAKRGRGRPAGTGGKMGAKGPSGRSKLMTKENDFDPADRGEYDQEGEMAKDSIQTVVRHAQALEKILGDNDNLPEWVQSKLAKIESMMTAVDDYMQNQEGDDEEMAMGEESTNKRDNHAEKAGRKVTKDIEYDEKKKDGIHGKKRGSEDDKAEKAGKKVAKDIEYDEKKDKKEDKPKKVKEQGGAETPTASSGFSFGKGIYDSMNRELEKMIAESMSVNMSDSTEGGKSLTITATDEDALKLAGLLKNAGLGGGDQMGHEMGTEHGEESCPSCGMSDCGCGDVHEALDENNPDWPTDTETSDDALQYSGGLNGPKSTGQTTIPVIASQDDRQHTYEDDQELRRMMEMAGVQQDNLKPWEQTMKEEADEEELDEAKKCPSCDCDPCECDESVTESFEQMLSRMRDVAGIKEAKKPDFLDMDKDGDKKEPMEKAVADKEKKVEESIFALTNQWRAYKG